MKPASLILVGNAVFGALAWEYYQYVDRDAVQFLPGFASATASLAFGTVLGAISNHLQGRKAVNRVRRDSLPAYTPNYDFANIVE